jgi:2-iminobutanoate/2-iminopropanoate deaminase
VTKPSRKEYALPGGMPPISHYTDAVAFGNLLFISGLAPVDAERRVVSDDVAEQAEHLFEQMKRILEDHGASFADVLRVTVYLLEVDDRKKINSIRQRYFGQTKPASTLIGVAQLAIPGMKVEIEAIAGIPGGA